MYNYVIYDSVLKNEGNDKYEEVVCSNENKG